MSSPKNVYLIIYNLAFALLWLTLLIQISALNPVSNYEQTYSTVGSLAEKIQVAAFLDVLHSATGSSIATPYTIQLRKLTIGKSRSGPSTTFPYVRPNYREIPHPLANHPSISRHCYFSGLHRSITSLECG